jgi:hypothetical protein
VSPARFEQVRGEHAATVATAMPRRVQVLAVSVAVVAVTIAVALIVDGQALPSAGPYLLLALVVGLSVNRVAFFPSELSATAEAAVLFTAVVAFRLDSPVLAPLLVALLVGPLDVLHWEQRSFVRMAYNSGSQGLAVVAGAVAFGVVSAGFGSSNVALVGAVAVAVLPYVVLDSVLGVVLMRLHGERSTRLAVRHQVSINGLAVSFALYGACVALVAGAVGWWLAFLMLAPMPFVPELVLVRARRVRTGSPLVVTASCVMAVSVVVLGLALAFPDPATLLVLLAVAVLVGSDARVSGSSPVPWVGAPVVAAAVIVSGSTGGLLAAVLVALATTAAAWATATERSGPAVAGALLVAGAGAVACTRVADGLGLGPRATLVGVTAAVAFQLVVIVAGSRRRRDDAIRAGWAFPAVCAAVVLALLWRALGIRGAPAFAIGVPMAAVAVAWCGAPPWRSRVLGRRMARVGGNPRLVMSLLGCVAVCGSMTAVAVESRQLRTELVLAATAVSEVVAAMAITGIRQWRFTPRRRVRDAAAVFAVALAVIVATQVPGGDSGALALSLLSGAACLLAASSCQPRRRRRVPEGTLSGRRSAR